MAKAINWPAPYRTEILEESTEQLCCALRLGNLYFEGRFWAPDEEVDIRCGHLRVRRGKVVGDMELKTLGQLEQRHFKALKTDLNSVEALIAFFKTHYDADVSNDDKVSVVFYKNLPINPEHMDAPDPSERYV